MGGGLHKSFSVKGSRTPASAWLNACRLARRGFIVILVDEFNSSKVTHRGFFFFLLQFKHRLNATTFSDVDVPVLRSRADSSTGLSAVSLYFFSQFIARPIALFLGVVLVASIDLRNKGMPDRRCRSRRACVGARDTAHLFGECAQADTTSRVLPVTATGYCCSCFCLFRMHERDLCTDTVVGKHASRRR